MVKFTVSRIIDVPLSQTWAILADFCHVHRVHPLVSSVDQLSDNDRGVNARRTCHLYSGSSVTEQVTEWEEESHRYTIKVVEGAIPVKKIVVTLCAQKEGEDRTKLVADMDMVAKFGAVGKIMEMVILKPQFGKAIGNLFAGIEDYAKTGKEIQKGYTAKTRAKIE